MLISKNWIHLPLIFCALSYFALLLAFLCPESPRWYLINGKSTEAIEELNKMASMNR